MEGASGENYGFCLVVGRAALNAFSITLISECIVLLSTGRVDGAQSRSRRRTAFFEENGLLSPTYTARVDNGCDILHGGRRKQEVFVSRQNCLWA